MYNKKTTSLLGAPINSSEADKTISKEIHNLDTQVKSIKPKIFRRKFNKADKLKILEEFDTCQDALERGAFLRKNGLYYASITKWRLQLNEKNLNHKHSKAYQLTLDHNQVIRENTALKKKLAQAEAIIELQKKVSELLSTHVLNPETSGE